MGTNSANQYKKQIIGYKKELLLGLDYSGKSLAFIKIYYSSTNKTTSVSVPLEKNEERPYTN